MKAIYHLHHLIEWMFASALFINALLFLPQLMLILKKKSSKSVSLITFLGFLLIQLTVILHGILHQDYLLIFGYLFSMIICGALVIAIVYYRKKELPHESIDFEAIFEQLPGHIYWKDRNGATIYCNRNNWEAFGLKSLSDYQGKTDYAVFPQEVADMLWRTDEEVMRTGQIRIVEEVDPTTVGEPRVYLSHKVPLRNKQSDIVGILGVSLDITEAKKINAERLELLDNITGLMPGHVYWVNRDGIYMGCNDNQAKSAGLHSRKAIVGKRNKDLPWNFNATALPEVLDKVNLEVMDTGKTITLEEHAITEDGQDETYLSNKVPIRNRSGNIIGMVGISINITRLKKTEQELIHAKETAEFANVAKTTFLYNMQHDLRTPFSGILGIAQFLETSEEDVVKKQKLGYISQSAQILLDHLNQIFEVVNLENGKVPVLEKQFNLHTLILDIDKMMLPAAKHKALNFNTQISDEVPTYIMGDKLRLQRILINLISNAIKFTEQGYIILSVQLVKKQDEKIIIKFTVEDTGIGIPEDKHHLVFEQFNRITPAYSGIYPGKGLGLRLVKLSLAEMGGEIHLDSKLGKGTIFKVLIPFKQTLLNCPENEL
jgi:two-component system aerobic respiration control sensor histidine kinase ArcB